MDEDIPEVPVDRRTKVGDIWIRGPHRTGCGNGRDVNFLRKIVGEGAKIDAAFLVPPMFRSWRVATVELGLK